MFGRRLQHADGKSHLSDSSTPTWPLVSIPQPAYHHHYQHQRSATTSSSSSSSSDDLTAAIGSCIDDDRNAASTSSATSTTTTTMIGGSTARQLSIVDTDCVNDRRGIAAGRHSHRHTQTRGLSTTSPAQPVLTHNMFAADMSARTLSLQASTSSTCLSRSDSPPRRALTMTSPVNNRYRFQQQQHYHSQTAPAMTPTRSRDRATTPLLDSRSDLRPQNMHSDGYRRGLIRLHSTAGSTCTCSSTTASHETLEITATDICHCYTHGLSSSSSAAFMQSRYRCRESFFRFRRAMHLAPGDWTDPLSGKWALPAHLRAYVPLLVWGIVSIAMAVIVGIWHSEVFSALDRLSTYLKASGMHGRVIMFLCIFITCFPPLPLYSTFIILSGYSFGLSEGFVVSYVAALSGAVVVYGLSRKFLRAYMETTLSKSTSFRRVVHAIEKRPKLLYLIRLSPYPYNLMNTLLASSDVLSFRCYFWCTALSLPKLLVHVGIGTTIRSFAAGNSNEINMPSGIHSPEEIDRQLSGERMKKIAGVVGLALCIGVFLYILRVVRKAVDEENGTDCSDASLTAQSPGYRRHHFRTSASSIDDLEIFDIAGSRSRSHTHQSEMVQQVLDSAQTSYSGRHARRHSYDDAPYHREHDDLHAVQMQQISTHSPLTATFATGASQRYYRDTDNPYSPPSVSSGARPVQRQVFTRQDSSWASLNAHRVSPRTSPTTKLSPQQGFSWSANSNSDARQQSRLPYVGCNYTGSAVPLLADIEIIGPDDEEANLSYGDNSNSSGSDLSLPRR